MNAFISFATHPSEQYIVSLLAKKLADNKIGVITNYAFTGRIDVQVAAQIRNATFFVGLVTFSGVSFRQNYVFEEFTFASNNHKPSILLVEQGVQVPPRIDSAKIIFFNRGSIDSAIQLANEHITAAKQAKEGANNAAWLLGGVAVVALLAILANEKK